MKKQTQNQAQNQAAQAAQVSNTKDVATYVQRMQANKNLLTCNLSKLFADIRKHTICPDVIAIEKNDFARFRAYMVERHKLEAGQTPKKGWSVWYGLQWYEKEIKRVANDDKNANFKRASNYLRITRAALQEKAAKEMF